MSSIGTGVAAGVAQTALQAQQSGRREAVKAQGQDRASQRLREVLRAQASGVVDEDTTDSAQLHLDQEMPDHQGPGYDQAGDDSPPDADAASTDVEAAQRSARPYGPPMPGGHLDIQA